LGCLVGGVTVVLRPVNRLATAPLRAAKTPVAVPVRGREPDAEGRAHEGGIVAAPPAATDEGRTLVCD
jgi:hypothetical protein